MKLTPARIERTLSQYDARAVPDSHPVMQEFNSLFGEHTFFVDQTGLCIVEPIAAPESGIEAGRVVKLASWIDDTRSRLAPHEREVTDVVVVLDKAA